MGANFEENGFELVERVLDAGEVAGLLAAVERLGGRRVGTGGREGAYGLRGLLGLCPEVGKVADSERLRALVRSYLGREGRVVRALFFDKIPEANWGVPWHQDLTIAVTERIEVAGFGPWSVKNGVVHVQAPVEVLARMVALRIHLDDCAADNGPLRVMPGSHRLGRLGAAEIGKLRDGGGEFACVARAGDVLAMRPLLLHASSPARRAGHRRVLHLEYGAGELPGGLRWSESL